ncbi:MAG: dipicolinate synthase subunit B [Oscillospiraceae bacterium]|jgi:dipicolinate synthase subunit B|nr:dipicolinate synthase subunit B [Oscillospiraceae bacterium]
MSLEQVRIGVGMTGSFCTFAAVFDALAELKRQNAALTFVLSLHVQQLSSRFGDPEETLQMVRRLGDGREPVTGISEAEPLGPNKLLDVFLIAPCTGNTLAKLANGITDTPVLMAAKGHLRNGKPLVIALASNDALGLNLKNIGILLGSKHIFFVPMGQDAPEHKPNSMMARTALIPAALEAALRNEQLEPVII